jgi:peptidoglycan-associated lipoprotein
MILEPITSIGALLNKEGKVMDSLGKVIFGLVVLPVSLAFAGCSSTDKKPEAQAAVANAPSEASKSAGAAPSSSTSSSSLEAAQRGESTATPASSALKDIYFDFDSYDLRADARATLKANGEWLKSNPSAQVQIEGHCDERGTTEYNLALGSKRAQSVKDYLVTLGTATDRLSTISYGEELPVCTEHNEDCWQKNRRARFVIQTARPTS